MKKILGRMFILLGAAALIYGIIMLFNGGVTNSKSWIATVLGFIFFGSGIGLLKSIKTIETNE